MAAVAEHLEVTPTLEEARALEGDHNLIPVTHSFIEDCETPVSAFLKLRGDGPAFLLESAEQGQQVGRYASSAGARSASCAGAWPTGETRTRSRTRPYPRSARPRSPACRRSRAAPSASSASTACAPSSACPSPTRTSLGLPDMALMLSDVIVAFDHLRHTVTILANAYLDDETGVDAAHARAVEAIRQVRTRLAGPLPRAGDAPARARRRVRVQHDPRGLRGQRRADHRVHLRRRRLPGGPVAALERADPGRAVLASTAACAR